MCLAESQGLRMKQTIVVYLQPAVERIFRYQILNAWLTIGTFVSGYETWSIINVVVFAATEIGVIFLKFLFWKVQYFQHLKHMQDCSLLLPAVGHTLHLKEV